MSLQVYVCIFLFSIRECERGYWPFVSYFTRSEAVQTIKNLSNVTTDLGRGMQRPRVHTHELML